MDIFKHICDVCGLVFSGRLSLTKHIREHDRTDANVCPVCGDDYETAIKLRAHMKIHSDSPSRNDDITKTRKIIENSDTTTRKKGEYFCEYCGAKFEYPSVLKQHLVVHTKEATFKCDLCPRKFTRTGQLTIHRRKHTGEKPFQCTLCDSRYSDRHALKRHHSNTHEKPKFECVVCSQLFGLEQDLRNHTKQKHTDQRVYECWPCSIPFVSVSGLKRHLFKKHPDDAAQNFVNVEIRTRLVNNTLEQYSLMKVKVGKDGARCRFEICSEIYEEREAGKLIKHKTFLNKRLIETSHIVNSQSSVRTTVNRLPDTKEKLRSKQSHPRSLNSRDLSIKEKGGHAEIARKNHTYTEKGGYLTSSDEPSNTSKKLQIKVENAEDGIIMSSSSNEKLGNSAIIQFTAENDHKTLFPISTEINLQPELTSGNPKINARPQVQVLLKCKGCENIFTNSQSLENHKCAASNQGMLELQPVKRQMKSENDAFFSNEKSLTASKQTALVGNERKIAEGKQNSHTGNAVGLKNQWTNSQGSSAPSTACTVVKGNTPCSVFVQGGLEKGGEGEEGEYLEVYQCQFCETLFRDESLYWHHVLNEEKHRLLTCKHCHTVFLDESSYEEHNGTCNVHSSMNEQNDDNFSMSQAKVRKNPELLTSSLNCKTKNVKPRHGVETEMKQKKSMTELEHVKHANDRQQETAKHKVAEHEDEKNKGINLADNAAVHVVIDDQSQKLDPFVSVSNTVSDKDSNLDSLGIEGLETANKSDNQSAKHLKITGRPTLLCTSKNKYLSKGNGTISKTKSASLEKQNASSLADNYATKDANPPYKRDIEGCDLVGPITEEQIRALLLESGNEDVESECSEAASMDIEDDAEHGDVLLRKDPYLQLPSCSTKEQVEMSDSEKYTKSAAKDATKLITSDDQSVKNKYGQSDTLCRLLSTSNPVYPNSKNDFSRSTYTSKKGSNKNNKDSPQLLLSNENSDSNHKEYSSIEMKENTHVCRICKTSFVEHRFLEKHIKTHAPLSDAGMKTPYIVSGATNSISQTVSKLKCHICGLYFQQDHFLQRHLKSIHDFEETGLNSGEASEEEESVIPVNSNQIANIETGVELPSKPADQSDDGQVFSEDMCALNTSTFSPGSPNKPETLHKNISSHFQCHLCDALFEEDAAFQEHFETHPAPTKKTTKDYEVQLAYSILRVPKSKKENMQSHTGMDTKQEDINDSQILEKQNSGDSVVKIKCEDKIVTPILNKPKVPQAALEFLKKVETHDKSNGVLLSVQKFECELCGKEFRTSQGMHLHITSRHGEKYNCTECNKTFHGKAAFSKHVMYRHATTGYSVNCDECGASFSSSLAYRNHRRSHDKKQNILFQCDKCPETFKQRFKLRYHYEKVHLNIKKVPKQYEFRFFCEVCGVGFAHKSQLLQHSVKHTGVKPYACSQCGKKFARLGDCNTHERNHTNPKQYSCKYCHETFSLRQTFERHEAKHTGNRPFDCTNCDRNFAVKHDFVMHIRNVHGSRSERDLKHVCGHCGKKFFYKSSLKRHESRLH